MDWGLSDRHREQIRQQMRTTTDARVCRRCAALLRLDQGETVASVAQEFAVSRQTLYNWRERVLSPLACRLSDSPRSGRPLGWTEQRIETLEELLRDSPRCHGFQAGSWTLKLLQTRLEKLCQWDVSRSSLREQLHQLDYVWKRFRYTLKPDPDREKKKTHP